MKNKPYISFLLPTRMRPDSLKKSLDSLMNTCSSIENYEVVVVFDEDDVETIDIFDLWEKNYNYTKVIVPRFGYDYLNEYYNAACAVAKGDWFWVWNDDTEMLNSDWDLILKEYDGQFVVLNPYNTREIDKEYILTHTLFPIVPRLYYDTLGRLSPWNHIDTYIEKLIGCLIKNEFRLCNSHDKQDDVVTKEIQYHRIPFPQNELNIDLAKLKSKINF